MALPSASTVELCTLIVSEIYGEVSSKVAAALLERGRLTLSSLCRHTRLPEKTVKQTLVVLIQQHLITHFTHLEGGREDTWYDCNWIACYELLHAGRIIRCMEERFGNDGATIISNLLQLGHARVGDFLAAYGISTSKGRKTKAAPKESEPKIEADAPISSVETLKAVMGEMLKGRFLVEVKDYDMHPPVDVENRVRAEITKRLRGQFTSELKLTKEVNIQLEKRLAEMKAGDSAEHAGMKRKATTAGGRAKKRKKSAYDEDEEEIEYEIDEDLIVRVNHAKFLLVFRNAELISLAEKRISKVTGQVYAEFLKLMESKVHQCHPRIGPEDQDDPKKRIKFTTNDVVRNFPKDIDLTDSVVDPPKDPVKKRKKRARSLSSLDSDSDDGRRSKGSKHSKTSSRASKKSNGKKSRRGSRDLDDSGSESDASVSSRDRSESEEESDDSDDDMDPEVRKRKKRAGLLKKHLELLAADTYHFVKFEGKRGNGEWSIDYEELGKKLRGLEIEKIVEERYTSVGTRLLRILKDKGKLEEKQLATISLTAQNTVRALVAGMHEAGILLLQEVPKSLPPQVSRTYFLWYVDESRANSLVLSDVYKAMARNMQRTNVERQKRKLLIEKSERTDVQENLEEYLTKSEKEELAIWRTREDKLLVQLMRLDRVVMILRDF
ncbi:hypothetical protein EX30DRAFT_317054 [Ascodesmis nigricans]|uniref:DNA-directed RNA polymerase III subunit RPC3 n=1 Tax=Ascodesmis nigricans TaxID=341454 RepID=A0A4S2N264_9PEZI|nr:hypothetical protein EX30DRAFT_317054 [Ascodesmis nigricans]